MNVEDKDVEKIVELAVAKYELRKNEEHSSELREIRDGQIRLEDDNKLLRAQLPGLIAEQVKACQIHQERRRRWNIGTWLTVFGLILANWARDLFSRGG